MGKPLTNPPNILFTPNLGLNLGGGINWEVANNFLQLDEAIGTGSSGNATSIQGVVVSGTAPTNGQVLEYNGTSWVPANAGAGSNYAVVYSTDYNWTLANEAGWGSLTAGTPVTLTITAAAPLGIDTSVRSTVPYYVYISAGTGTAEPVLITGGNATGGLTGKTITFTPFFSHSGAFTLSSASAGIQEAINVAGGISSNAALNGYGRVIVPPTGLTPYTVYATIAVQQNEFRLEGYGSIIDHVGRGPCFQIGDLKSADNSSNISVAGFTMRAPTSFTTADYKGSLITTTVTASGVRTITTNAAHNLRVGDMVTILLTDSTSYWGDVPSIASVPSSTTFTYATPGGDIISQTTPGIVALNYCCFLDNANGTHFQDIRGDDAGNVGKFNCFIDFWDDENATIDCLNVGNMFNSNTNWIPSVIASYGSGNLSTGGQQLAPVIGFRDSSVTSLGAGVTVFNSNGLYIDNVILQDSCPWQIHCGNSTGNFQGGAFRNLYSESNSGLNPAGHSPYGGLGIAGAMLTSPTGATNYSLAGQQFSSGPSVYPTIAGTGAAITATSLTSNVLTVTSTNHFVAGDKVKFAGTAESFLNGQTVTVLSSGLSTSQFEANFTHANFANASDTGTASCTYTYYVVIHDTTTTTSSPAMPLCFATGGGGTIVVSWPRVANGTDSFTYDVLRISGDNLDGLSTVSPYTGGCPGGTTAALGSVVTAQGQQSGFIQTFTDDLTVATTSYPTVPIGTYRGLLFFWPGTCVSNSITPLFSDNIQPVFSTGAYGGSTNQCLWSGYGSNQSPATTAGMFTNFDPGNTAVQQPLILNDGPYNGGGQTANVKGRLQFATSGAATTNTGHLITLVDSNPVLTRAYTQNRPPNSASDSFIGLDSGNVVVGSASICFGSPVALSNYIGNVGDGSSWKERLTSSLKTFATNVQLNSGLKDSTGALGTNGQFLTTNGSATLWATGVSAASPTFTGTAAFTNISVSGEVKDSAGSAGTSGYYLQSTGTGTQWASVGGGGAAWSAATAATGNLTLSNTTFTTEFDQTSAATWLWANTTTATSGTTNASPILELGANYWTGSVSAQDLWTFGTALAAGTNKISTLTIGHSGSTGAPQISIPWGGTSNINPDIIGAGGITTGISVGAAAQYPLKVIGPSGTSLHALAAWNGNTLMLFIDTNTDGTVSFINQNTGQIVLGRGGQPASNIPLVAIGPSSASFVGNTSGNNIVLHLGTAIQGASSEGAGINWAPVSGSGSLIPLQISPTINQTGSASGNYTCLLINPTETAVLGTACKLLDIQVGGSSKFTISNKGHINNCVADVQGNITSVSGTTVSLSYTNAYGSTPTVVVTPSTNAGSFYLSASSTTGFTITYSTSGAQTFNYMVMGNAT